MYKLFLSESNIWYHITMCKNINIEKRKSKQIIIIIYSFRVFHISFNWCFFIGVWVTASLLKSPGLLVFWPFSTRPLTSKSSRPFNNPLVTVPKVPITIGTIVTFMFHSFFNSLGKVEVLILLFTLFQFSFMVNQDGKVNKFSFFFFSFFIDHYKVYIIIVIYYSLEFFTSATSDGLSLEFEWQQISSSLQDSPQYSGRFQ